MLHHRRRVVLLLLAPVLLAAGLTTAQAGTAPSTPLTVEVLSTRPDLVSGGDALLAVTVPLGTDARRVRVAVDGRDVTRRLTPTNGRRFVGLVEGLRVGRNVVTAADGAGRTARLTVTNHPSGGPVIAGPQVLPWICDNEAGGNNPPQDAQCTTTPKYALMYRSGSGFAAYDEASPPSDVPMTTTDQGRRVPYVVRVERGTMDRGNYVIAVLWDVARDRPSAWNRKLLVPFGASTAVHHGSGAPTSVLDDLALRRGFLVANNSLNIHGQNANDVVSAEAVLMLKERIVERYGPIRYTMGNGCSGGAIQQYMLTSMYPGLLDGIQPSCSFSDVFTTAPDVLDCHLLIEYFTRTSPALWASERQRTAVSGHRDQSDCAAWEATFAGSLEPSRASNCALPQEQVYDENTNPRGVRCTIPDYMVSVFGRRPPSVWTPVEKANGRGFAQVALGNRGVQYGLKALSDGQITPAQFVDLNARIGGISIDNDFIPERITADPGAAEIAYRTGQISDPRQWAKVPIVDLRGYSESAEIHTSFYSYQARARLDRALGHHDNQLIWTFPAQFPILGIGPTRAIAERSFLLLDRWLTRIEADRRAVPLEQKVRAAKPSDATDKCFVNDQEQPQSSCDSLFPPYSVPRVVAGGPVTNDVVSCALRPLRRADYPATLTDLDFAALQKAFPSGVCDHTRTALGQRASVPWQSYAGGPGGRPLGAAPRSAERR